MWQVINIPLHFRLHRLPALFTYSSVSIQRSSLESDSCEDSVVNQMTSGSSTVTVMETLSCRYAGRRVTYCLQFSTDECQSNIVMETTPQCTYVKL